MENKRLFLRGERVTDKHGGIFLVLNDFGEVGVSCIMDTKENGSHRYLFHADEITPVEDMEDK